MNLGKIINYIESKVISINFDFNHLAGYLSRYERD